MAHMALAAARLSAAITPRAPWREERLRAALHKKPPWLRRVVGAWGNEKGTIILSEVGPTWGGV